MTDFQVTANGTDMGTYQGEDEDGALDAYAQDAGYDDYDDLIEQVPGASREDVTVTEA